MVETAGLLAFVAVIFRYHFGLVNQRQQRQKTYIGMTASTFKDKYRNHEKSFDDIKGGIDTELPTYVWKLKLDKKKNSINLLIFPEEVQSKPVEIVAIYV